jgi:hypothetical protein
MTREDLAKEWIELKEQERSIIDRRRQVEDALALEYGIREDLDGVSNLDLPGYKIKVTGRMNQKIDPDLLQELAAEAGISHLLTELFRWKAEIVKRKWDGIDPSIASLLQDAITTTPGRPSFSIAQED